MRKLKGGEGGQAMHGMGSVEEHLDMICWKNVGGGSGSNKTAINSVKNAKMKRVGAGWGMIQLVDR